MDKAKEILYMLVGAMVDYPDSVEVTASTDERGVLLALDVHREDMGKVIGREGKTASAIRLIIRVIGKSADAHVSIQINEPAGSSRAPRVSDRGLLGE